MNIKLESAFVLSHLGLGDNITMIGAVNFLLNYYDTIYFLCKASYQKNIELLFSNKPVIIIPINSKNENIQCYNIIKKIYKMADVFIDGVCHKFCSSKITHPVLLNRVKDDTKYGVKYTHISKFYNNMGLDTSIYYDNFHIDSSETSKMLLDTVKQYKIIFLHTKASDRILNLDDMINLYKHNDDYILICADKNVYNEETDKRLLAEQFVNIMIVHYIDIIKNAEQIHVIDSCFSCIVYPLLQTGRLLSRECVIYDREYNV